ELRRPLSGAEVSRDEMGLIERDEEPRRILVFDLQHLLPAVGRLARADPAEFPDAVIDVDDEIAVVVLADAGDLLTRLQLAGQAVAPVAPLVLVAPENLRVAQDREPRVGDRETPAQGPDDRLEKTVLPGLLE